MLIGGDGDEGQPKDTADAAVRVVSLIRGSDCHRTPVVRVAKLTGNPEGFEVGKGPSTGEVAEVTAELEHLRECGYGFDLHSGAGASAVERVIIGIDRHGQRVGGTGDRMGRLQHLAGVERGAVGIVILEPGRYLLENLCTWLTERRRRIGREVGETFVQSALGFGEDLEEFVLHG